MGKNIKIELELPEFDKELVVSVILKRDGEALVASSPAGVSTTLQGDPGRAGYMMNNEESGSAWKQSAVPESRPTSKMTFPKPSAGTSGGNQVSGNMMDMSF